MKMDRIKELKKREIVDPSDTYNFEDQGDDNVIRKYKESTLSKDMKFYGCAYLAAIAGIGTIFTFGESLREADIFGLINGQTPRTAIYEQSSQGSCDFRNDLQKRVSCEFENSRKKLDNVGFGTAYAVDENGNRYEIDVEKIKEKIESEKTYNILEGEVPPNSRVAVNNEKKGSQKQEILDSEIDDKSGFWENSWDKLKSSRYCPYILGSSSRCN